MCPDCYSILSLGLRNSSLSFWPKFATAESAYWNLIHKGHKGSILHSFRGILAFPRFRKVKMDDDFVLTAGFNSISVCIRLIVKKHTYIVVSLLSFSSYRWSSSERLPLCMVSFVLKQIPFAVSSWTWPHCFHSTCTPPCSGVRNVWLFKHCKQVRRRQASLAGEQQLSN